MALGKRFIYGNLRNYKKTMKYLFRFIRPTIQIFGVIISNLYIGTVFRNQLYTGPLKSICVPFLYCHSCPSAPFACPVGLAQHYAAIRMAPFFLLGHLAIIGLFVGRMVCGWICPFGFLQDILFRVKTSVKKIPAFLKHMPWVFLLVTVIALPFFTTEHWFSKLCPVGTLVAGIPWVFWNPVDPATGNLTIEPGSVSFIFFVKLFILFGCLIAFVYIKRPFCRFVCPMGLFWSFFNKISVLQLEVGEGCKKGEGCKGNIRCQQKCPMDIKVYENPNAGDCVRCLECTATCDYVKVSCAWPGKTESAENRIADEYE